MLDHLAANALANDDIRLARYFGEADDLLPLWVAEPYLGLSPAVVEAIQDRAATPWFGYETRPDSLLETFWNWMGTRHGWNGSDLKTLVSPSVGTSIGVLTELFSEPGDGVILQPPVFTDFKPLVSAAKRGVVRNPLILTDAGYRMNFDHLAVEAADPRNRMLILCNPHNPVGRVWSAQELSAVAAICSDHDVFVVADEIHADLALSPHQFTPFAVAAEGSGVSWAATHGPIKTFGLAGVCDTLVVTDDEDVAQRFRSVSAQLNLNRNNVLGVAAFEAGYSRGGPWLDEMLGLVSDNIALLQGTLPSEVRVTRPEGTYLAWLDFRPLGFGVPELTTWLVDSAKLAMSPGHWFGREGAGFARMTVAASPEVIEEAATRLTQAIVAL